MEPTTRHIEIFAPFGEAFDLMKKICFQPFDLGKWFVIGFAAWLATFFGGGAGYGWKNHLKDNHWSYYATHQGPAPDWHGVGLWSVPLFLILFLCIFAFVALVVWLNSRARFIFTDCIVHNRGAFSAPWREYHPEGNGLFVFQIAAAFVTMVFFAAGTFFFLTMYVWARPASPPFFLIVLGVCWVLLFLFYNLILHFMVPVMYRQRCAATTAFRETSALVGANLGLFLLFVLFYFVLWLAAIAIACVAGCLTCCLAAIPYLGTVILLPVVIVLYAFPLCFIRQFGDAYDVWATLPAAPEPPPPQAPPVQELPPPL